MNDSTASSAGARLAGRTVILTGAAGNLGTTIARQLLREGARLVMTGRNADKLNAFVATLREEGFPADHLLAAVGDAADPQACRDVVAAAARAFGEIHALVNNAGGAGPKQTLQHIPFTAAEARLVGEGETMMDAAMNLIGGPWHMTRAALPHMAINGAVVNVSTIFSRTAYFGRIPYVVPKSGLNTLSAGLAAELGAGERGIRVNTVYPGPIESERIDNVFAAMDKLQGQTPGTTSHTFRSLMLARRADTSGALDFRYPTPADVAATITFLATPESIALAGHAFEVTNGMQVAVESRSRLVSWPDDRLVDLRDRVVLILAGSEVDDALVFADRHLTRGAQVVLAFRTLEALGHARARVQARGTRQLRLQHLDPLRRESTDRAFQFVMDHFGRLDGVIVLPAHGNGEHGPALSTATDEDVRKFVEQDLVAPVAFASSLARHLSGWSALRQAPAITFVTNPDDGRGNRFNEVTRAAVEALIRVWRHEEAHAVSAGERAWSCLPNQIVRYDNDENDNLAFCADWTATLNNRVRRMDPINLWIPRSIERATGKSAMPMSIQRVLPGLHQGKTVVITGGSLGIGMQLGRYLALAGARVLLSARSAGKLDAAREEIITELRGIGYAEPEERVFVLAGIDVGDEAGLQQLFEHAIELFGEVDYLINNAGISGAEEMVVDMTLEAWERTMQANLVSNYSLIAKFAPRMKARGSGRILNVSSYFGGEKYLAVAYPNRADYTVSKAGQRVLAEILSRHLGPEIQINAMAPGPVDGVRLRGEAGAPGLFARRGRLVLENKRLNEVHAAMLAALDDGADAESLLPLAGNRLDGLVGWSDAPAPLAKLIARLAAGRGDGSAASHLLNEPLARKLMARLVTGARFTPALAARFVDALTPAPAPFFDDAEVRRSADRIESGILDRLHLHRMPTDEQVALSTVFSLADEIVSGETFHPSGGLKFDRSVTEGELMLRPGREDLAQLAGRHVVLVGDAMREELAVIAEGFMGVGVASLTLLTRSEETAQALRHRVEATGGTALEVRAIGDALEAALDAVAAERGRIDVVVSTPFPRLPLNALTGEAGGSWERVLSHQAFAALVRDQLTHHFRIARRAALIPRCQIVLVTPDTSRASTREEFALALFVKNALHAFTVTLGVESERLPTMPAVNQVQLTRRARAEEPGNDDELAEEMQRLVYAVLQCAVPAPSPSESRYLARIFRGNAVTV